MPLLEEHFALLRDASERRKRFAEAALMPVSNGTALVQLRRFALPPGWNTTDTDVYFIVPVGYPVARPDTFWTDGGLRLANGGIPMSTGNNQVPGIPPNLLWFSWHPSTWNPNTDNLVTYTGMIARRFEDKR